MNSTTAFSSVSVAGTMVDCQLRNSSPRSMPRWISKAIKSAYVRGYLDAEAAKPSAIPFTRHAPTPEGQS